MDDGGRSPAERLGTVIATVAGAFAIAFVVAIIQWNTYTCSYSEPDDTDCGPVLAALWWFVASMAVMPVLALPVLALIARLGTRFALGATGALVLIGLGTFGLAFGLAWGLFLLYPVGLAVLIAVVASTRKRNSRPAGPWPGQPDSVSGPALH